MQFMGTIGPRYERMSRKGSDRINGEWINGLFHLLIDGIYSGQIIIFHQTGFP